jgi:hypothetical protein
MLGRTHCLPKIQRTFAAATNRFWKYEISWSRQLMLLTETPLRTRSALQKSTVVSGISGVADMKKVGRVGGKALLYFEVVSTLAGTDLPALPPLLAPGR